MGLKKLIVTAQHAQQLKILISEAEQHYNEFKTEEQIQKFKDEIVQEFKNLFKEGQYSIATTSLDEGYSVATYNMWEDESWRQNFPKPSTAIWTEDNIENGGLKSHTAPYITDEYRRIIADEFSICAEQINTNEEDNVTDHIYQIFQCLSYEANPNYQPISNSITHLDIKGWWTGALIVKMEYRDEDGKNKTEFFQTNIIKQNMPAIGFVPKVGCFYVPDTTIEVELFVDDSWLPGQLVTSSNSSGSTSSISSESTSSNSSSSTNSSNSTNSSSSTSSTSSNSSESTSSNSSESTSSNSSKSTSSNSSESTSSNSSESTSSNSSKSNGGDDDDDNNENPPPPPPQDSSTNSQGSNTMPPESGSSSSDKSNSSIYLCKNCNQLIADCQCTRCSICYELIADCKCAFIQLPTALEFVFHPNNHMYPYGEEPYWADWPKYTFTMKLNSDIKSQLESGKTQITLYKSIRCWAEDSFNSWEDSESASITYNIQEDAAYINTSIQTGYTGLQIGDSYSIYDMIDFDADDNNKIIINTAFLNNENLIKCFPSQSESAPPEENPYVDMEFAQIQQAILKYQID